MSIPVPRRALVLSGGGMFGAWQAGVWAALAGCARFDLIVGASVGALNGYAIACGVTPEQLRALWLDPTFTSLPELPATVQSLMQRAHPKTEFAVAVTDLLRLKPRLYTGDEVRAEHLIASCSIPLVLPQVRIDGRLYSDGGLLNPLPLWAAVELGATHVFACNALPRGPSAWIRPLMRTIRAVAGHHPPAPPEVKIHILKPAGDLGTVRQSLRWDRDRVERWLDQGEAEARAALADPVVKKTFPF